MKNFLDKLSNKEKLGLMLAAAFLLFAFVDRLIVSPIRDNVMRINKSIEINEKQLGWNLRNINQKPAIVKEYNKIIPPVKKIGSDEEEVAKILGEIEALARKNSVSLVDMKPQKATEEDFYTEYNVEIELEGEVDAVIAFLHSLNVSPQILRAEKIRFSAQKQSSTKVKVTILASKVLIL